MKSYNFKNPISVNIGTRTVRFFSNRSSQSEKGKYFGAEGAAVHLTTALNTPLDYNVSAFIFQNRDIIGSSQPNMKIIIIFDTCGLLTEPWISETAQNVRIIL